MALHSMNAQAGAESRHFFILFPQPLCHDRRWRGNPD
jgi:hypothetical protein